jgi:hypothetical protein
MRLPWRLKDIHEFDKIYDLNKISDRVINRRGIDDPIYDFINDPDGYVNVRKEPTTSSEVLFKINKF